MVKNINYVINGTVSQAELANELEYHCGVIYLCESAGLHMGVDGDALHGVTIADNYNASQSITVQTGYWLKPMEYKYGAISCEGDNYIKIKDSILWGNRISSRSSITKDISCPDSEGIWAYIYHSCIEQEDIDLNGYILDVNYSSPSFADTLNYDYNSMSFFDRGASF